VFAVCCPPPPRVTGDGCRATHCEQHSARPDSTGERPNRVCGAGLATPSRHTAVSLPPRCRLMHTGAAVRGAGFATPRRLLVAQLVAVLRCAALRCAALPCAALPCAALRCPAPCAVP
jgi:hypothetical protein